MYKADGTQLRSMKVPVTEDPPCVRAFRDELALWCIKEAQRQYPQAIDFHFNSPIQSVNFDRQVAHVHAVESHATKVCSKLALKPDAVYGVMCCSADNIHKLWQC